MIIPNEERLRGIVATPAEEMALVKDLFTMEATFHVEEKGLHVLIIFDRDHGKLIAILPSVKGLLHA